MLYSMTTTKNETARYTITGVQNTPRYSLEWIELNTADAPTIGATAFAALRNRVCDRRHQTGDPIAFYAGDSGATMATADLHIRGEHDAAMELGKLMHWAIQRATAKDIVIWTVEAV